MAVNDSNILNKLEETLKKLSKFVQSFVDVLSEWKVENDAHRARLDAIGEKMSKNMEEIQNVVNQSLARDASQKSAQLSQPSVKSEPCLPISLKVKSGNVLRGTPVLKPQKPLIIKSVPIKKEILDKENTTNLPNLMTKNYVTSTPIASLPRVAKTETPDILASRVIPILKKRAAGKAPVSSNPKIPRTGGTELIDSNPKIPRTTRSQAKTALNKDILESNSGMAGLSGQSINVPDRSKKISKDGVKRT